VIRRALVLGTLLAGGCDDSNVAVCWGNGCGFALAQPAADAGPNQTVDGGVLVELDGSGSRAGGAAIASYSWTQTAGTAVALTDADQAHASFVAPNLAAQETLTFRLTIVDSVGNADSDATDVTVRAVAPAPLAVELLDGPLRPASPDPVDPSACPSATAALPADVAAAQLGLWLAARTFALAEGTDRGDPSDWLDLVRRLVADGAPPPAGLPGQLESFGYLLLQNTLIERDPALGEAIAARLRDAPQLADPAGLLAGRLQPTQRATPVQTVAMQATTDPAQATDRAIATLLAAHERCVDATDALAVTTAALRVVAAAAP
jgi:hypothetical protein